MKKILVVLAALTGCAQAPSQQSVDAHVAEAKRLAGSDLAILLPLCQPASPVRPPQAQVDAGILKQIMRPVPAPFRAFDNLYFVGGAWSSAWAITTPAGIIVLDALNNEKEAEIVIDGGMRKVGLDPAQMRYVIVSHAHGDHYGGADYLVRKYRPRVVLSDIDWVQTETKLEFNSPHWGPVPKRDIAVKDGDQISLGGTHVTTYITPGHTLGTVTSVFDVRSGGRTHKVMLWGGTAFNFGRDLPRLDAYYESTRKMARIAEEQGIDVLISNHAGWDGALEKFAALQKSPGGPNPFVIGTPNVVRAMNVMGECALAQKDRYLLMKD